MRIPRFWEKAVKETILPDGRRIKSVIWEWSESSAEDAQTKAQKACQRIAARLASEEALPQQYGYGERRPREEIIEELADDEGHINAVVTRNGYGSLILNTSELVFIDIDLPPRSPQIRLPAFLLRWLGKEPPKDPVAERLENIRSSARAHSKLGFRIYRTCAGFRVVVVNRRMEAHSSLAKKLLNDFDADPLYRRMCENQECFRARLTPKPWRCRIERPPARYPFATPTDDLAYRRWEQAYLQGTADFGTCQHLENIGPQEIDSSLEKLIELHDRLTKATLPQTLA